MTTKSKSKLAIRANRLVAQLARSVENRDCSSSAKLITRASAALVRAAGSPKKLQYTPGYGRFLRLEAQHQVSCQRRRR